MWNSFKTFWGNCLISAIFALSLVLNIQSVRAIDYIEITSAGLDTINWEGGHTELEFYDINGDGNLDVLSIGDHGSPFINSQEHGVMVYFGNGAGGFSLFQNGNFGYGGIAVGDVNNDGFPDIGYGMHHNYSGNDFGDQLIETALGDGTGMNWIPWDDSLATQGETYGMFATDFGDIDNDGDLDLACTSFGYGNPLQIYRNQLDGSWHFVESLSTGNCDMIVQFGDINIDGKIDIVTAYQNHTAWFGTGTGYFVDADYNLPPGPLYGISLGDVDNDGGMDLAYWDGGMKVKLWDETSNSWRDVSAGLPTTGSGYTALYDMNSDGFCDLVGGSAGHVYIYLGDGSGQWTLGANYIIESDPDASFEAFRAGGDVDHNGYPDIVHLTEEGGPWVYTNHIRMFVESSVADSLWIRPLFPKGAETLLCGSVRFIEWACEVPRGETGSITLQYSTTGSGGPWNNIASNIPNSGKYQWTVPDFINSSNCFFKYRVTSASGTVEVLSGAVRIYEPAELLEISVTPLGTPIVIPASGGSFSYNVQAIAPLDVNAGFDFWTMVILPDGSIYGPLFLRKGILLAGGTMIQRTLSQYVPASAPAGTYTFYAYAGVYDNGEAWYDEFFFFQKEGSENTTGKGSWATSGWDAEQSGDLTEEGILGEYKLFQSYPNPFNTSTILQIELPQKSQVNLELYNINGQLVRTIYSGIQNAGSFQFRFEASDLPSGVYFCKMKAESLESANKFSGIGKLILLK